MTQHSGTRVLILALILLCSFVTFSWASTGEEDFAPSHVLVRLDRPLDPENRDGRFALDTGRPALDALIREAGVKEIRYALEVSMGSPRNSLALARHGLDRTYRFHVQEGADILALADKLSQVPGVIYAEPDYLMRAAVLPDDTRFDEQWSLNNSGQTGGCSDADVDAPEAWDITTGGPVVIAILDSGCDSDHPDLIGKLEPGHDFVNGDDDPEDDRGHGTQVGSVVGANTNNADGIAGMCWGCRLMPLKVFDADGNGASSRFADACVWATDHGARIINYSGGGSSPSQTRLSGVGYAYDAGVVIAASSGNDGVDAIGYPARRAETLALGLTRDCDERGPLSNFGSDLDVVAPGYEILMAQMDGGYGTASGTSFAAPHTSGLLGLMHTLNPSLGIEEGRHLIRSGAEDEVGSVVEDTPGFDIYMGWGRINAHRTLQGVSASTSLRVDGKLNTRPYFETANPLAESYDFVRGDLNALTESNGGVELGALTCVEDDSVDPDTTGDEDSDSPGPGEAFFYLARFNAAPGPGSYGGSSNNRDRVTWVEGDPSVSWHAESDQAGALFGEFVYTAGDVNGDTYDDVIVGARDYDNDQVDEGRVFVYLGSATGLESTEAWTAESDQTDSLFGWSVATAGDVNGDGYDDVIVGAQNWDGDLIDEGKAFVYLGSASGLSATPSWTAEGDQADAHFGFRVRSAGDVNADGYDDVIIGAYLYDSSGGAPADRPDRGRVFVWLGSESGLQEGPADWWFEPDQAVARAGIGLGTAGDVNGDGYDDVIVGAPLYDNGHTNEGRLFVFHGSASGLSTTPDAEMEIDVVDARLGYTAGTAGDVDGDGYDDVIAGAFFYSNGETEEGAVYVFLGSPSGVETSAAWSLESDQAGARLGIAADSAGDTNGDGYDDIIVGAHYFDGGSRSDSGHAWLFLGSAAGLGSTADWTGFPIQTGAEYGRQLATAGDVNGDDLSDVVIGSPGYDHGQFEEGRAWVYLGPLAGETAPPQNGCPD